MENEIFVIKKTEFDNFENHHPYIEKILCCIETEEDAKIFCEELDKEAEKYKGWDKQMYPKFKYEKTILFKRR